MKVSLGVKGLIATSAKLNGIYVNVSDKEYPEQVVISKDYGLINEFKTPSVALNNRAEWKVGVLEKVWPMLGNNPQRTGKTIFEVDTSKMDIQWAYETGWSVKVSPVIGADGTIYVGSTDSNFYALNPDGTLKWKYGLNNRIYSTAALGADGTIYFGSDDMYLYALNPDGTLKWKYKTGDGIRSSPVIGADGTIYVGSSDNYLYALNPDGTLKWKYETGALIVSSPALGMDGTIYFGSYDTYLYALNPDGTLKWKYKNTNPVYESPSVGADGTVYLAVFTSPPRLLTQYTTLIAISSDGELKWSKEIGTGIGISPNVSIDGEGNIYVGGGTLGVVKVSPSGEILWTNKINTQYPVTISNNNIIFVGSTDGNIYILSAKGDILGRVDTNRYGLPNSTSNILTSAAIGPSNTVYAGGENNYVYAIR